MKPEDFPEPVCELWESNRTAFDLYCIYSTQWRTGPAGAIGLDYPVFFHHLDRTGVTGEAFEEVMAQLRVIESAALDEFNK